VLDLREPRADPQDEVQALEVELAFGDESRLATTRRRRGSAIGRRPRLVPLVVAAVVGAAIAGGIVIAMNRPGEENPATGAKDDKLLTVLVDGMHERFGDTVTDAEVRCIADGMVRSVGRQRLIDVGVLDGADPVLSLDLAEKHVAVPRAFDCLDDQTMLAVMVASWPKEGVGQLGPEVAPCIFGGWLKEIGRDRLVYVFTTLFDAKPAPLNETLNPDEFDIAIKVLNDCQQSVPAA